MVSHKFCLKSTRKWVSPTSSRQMHVFAIAVILNTRPVIADSNPYVDIL